MKKKIFLIFIMIFTFVLGVNFVNAEEVEVTGSVKITGRNTYGRTLTAEAACTKPATGCTFEYQWYSNTTNTTTGGTKISGANSRNYVIDKSLSDKYIYVIVTVKPSSTATSTVEFVDITDDANNNNAKVESSYIYINNYVYGTWNTTKEPYEIETFVTHEVGADLKLTIKNIPKDDEANYFVIFTNKDDKAPVLTETSAGCDVIEADNDDIRKPKTVTKQNGEIIVSNDWYMLEGYDYAYIVRRRFDENAKTNYCSISKNPIKVEKPALPKLGERYQFFLFTETEYKRLSTLPLFPRLGKNGDHNMKTKIGIINDNSLLTKLANNYEGSLEELLEYAKKHDGTIFNYNDEDNQKVDIGSFKVINGAYYYVYTTYEDKNGMYRDLEDVTVVMGHLDSLINDVKWEDSKPAVKNPNTGLFEKYGIFGLIAVVGIGIFLIVRRHNKFPKSV